MSVKIAQWNIKGYFNNYNELDLLVRDTKPHLICLQETHIPHHIKHVATPKNYVGYFNNSQCNNTSKQGVAILIKRDIPHRIIFQNSMPLSISIEFHLSPPFTIINTYIPPSQKFSESDIFSLLSNTHNSTLLLGDFNAWSPLWGSPKPNSRGITMENIILTKNLVILNDGSPTHHSTHNTFTHIDLTLVEANLSPRCTWHVLDNLYGSDHYPILCEMQTNSLPCLLKKSPKFKTDAANWQLYQSLCERNFSNWNSTNTHQHASKITKAIKTAANIAIPQSNTSHIKKYSTWWNKDLNTLRTNKQNLWQIYKSAPSLPNLIEYKKANARFKKSVKTAKRSSITEFTKKINPTSTPKKIWASIKSLTGLPPTPITTIRLPNNKILSCTSDIATAFGQTWSDYAMDSNFPLNYITNKRSILSQTYNPHKLTGDAQSLEVDFTPTELQLSLQHAKGKSPGRDRISYPMLYNLPISCKKSLLSLYNKILQHGCYPHPWLSATTIPIQKPNKPTNKIDGYRPISLLSCMGKILEKMLAKRLMWFITKNNLVSHKQIAFKKQHGTLDGLLPLQHYIADSLTKKNHVTILATDFEKAFDRIGAHIVIEQLASWGVGPKIYKLIKSFLTNRKFHTRVNGYFSPTYSLENGIPQGSPLSVVLFIIAFEQLNKVTSVHKNLDFRIYADDAFYYTKIKDINNVQRTLSKLLEDINSWGQYSGANLAHNKCKILHVCRKSNCPQLQVNTMNTTIENVNYLKLLGIIFDAKYTYKEHCIHLKKNLIARLNIIKYLTSKHLHIHTNTLVNITRSLILSKIDYGLPIYGGCASSHLKILNKPYHTAVRRSVYAFPTSPIKCVLAEAGLPSILERYKTATLRLIPKILTTTNRPLFDILKNASKHKGTYKIKSTIRHCISNLNDLDIKIPQTCSTVSRQAPWLLHPSSINYSLHSFQKNNTNPDTFKQLYHELVNKKDLANRSLLFTDGSKIDHSTTFAVVDNNGKLLTGGRLPSYNSIFSSEAFAILKAVTHASNVKGKFAIFTDSFSTLQSLNNIHNSNQIISQIRDHLIKKAGKIKIIWIPSHKGITGNEYADSAAKSLHLSPVIMFNPPMQKDICKLITHYLNLHQQNTWTHFNHPYTNLNPECKKSIFPSTLSKTHTSIFTRLRIGHSKLTHEHLLSSTPPSACPFCRNNLNILHILDNCPALYTKRQFHFNSTQPSKLLKNITIDNVLKIFNFIKDINLINSI